MDSVIRLNLKNALYATSDRVCYQDFDNLKTTDFRTLIDE